MLAVPNYREIRFASTQVIYSYPSSYYGNWPLLSINMLIHDPNTYVRVVYILYMCTWVQGVYKFPPFLQFPGLVTNQTTQIFQIHNSHFASITKGTSQNVVKPWKSSHRTFIGQVLRALQDTYSFYMMN